MSRNPKCLHCVLHDAIEGWAVKYAERNGDGAIVLDMAGALTHLGQVMGELVHKSDDPKVIEQFERFSRECLEAGFRYAASGDMQMVEVGPQAGSH